MNIDKDLANNGIDLDDDVLYNFKDDTSLLMRDDGVTVWKGPQEKHTFFFKVLIDALLKLEGIITNLTTSTCLLYT